MEEKGKGKGGIMGISAFGRILFSIIFSKNIFLIQQLEFSVSSFCTTNAQDIYLYRSIFYAVL